MQDALIPAFFVFKTRRKEVTSATRIKTLRSDLERLKKIKKDMDPASGITVSVIRGPVNNDSEFDIQPTILPVAVEVCTKMDEILDAIINSLEDSISFNVAFCKQEMLELKKVLGTE